MRRLLIALVALSLGVVALVSGAGAAGAATFHTATSSPPCPNATTYPPVPAAQIAASTTTPTAGQTIEASGMDYCPNESVALTLAGVSAGTAHTDGSGKFDPPVVVPGPAGVKELCGIGASGLSDDRSCIDLTVKASGGSGTAPTSTGGLPFTGTETALLIAVAAVLLGGGAMFTVAGRRRKSTSHS